jgi:hypothetical protein
MSLGSGSAGSRLRRAVRGLRWTRAFIVRHMLALRRVVSSARPYTGAFDIASAVWGATRPDNLAVDGLDGFRKRRRSMADSPSLRAPEDSSLS